MAYVTYVVDRDDTGTAIAAAMTESETAIIDKILAEALEQ